MFHPLKSRFDVAFYLYRCNLNPQEAKPSKTLHISKKLEHLISIFKYPFFSFNSSTTSILAIEIGPSQNPNSVKICVRSIWARLRRQYFFLIHSWISLSNRMIFKVAIYKWILYFNSIRLKPVPRSHPHLTWQGDLKWIIEAIATTEYIKIVNE